MSLCFGEGVLRRAPHQPARRSEGSGCGQVPYRTPHAGVLRHAPHQPARRIEGSVCGQLMRESRTVSTPGAGEIGPSTSLARCFRPGVVIATELRINQRGVSKAAGAGNSCESPVPYPLRVPEEQVLRRV